MRSTVLNLPLQLVFPGANPVKRFTAVLYFTNFRNKLEHLSLASLSYLVQCLWVRPGAYTRVEHQPE
jgi:hypothetical protein